ncbi:TPA: hypothetical protein ACXIMI_002592 [Stenotrophomonas maltophilia]
MAATRNLELAMRIALDIEQAQKALPVLQRGLASVKDAGTAAGAGLEGVTKGADKAAGALDQASRSSASAADRVRTAGASMQKTVADEIRSISELDARLQQGAASMSELADTEALLDRVMARGLITAEDYNSALKTLDKQEASLSRTEQQRQRSLEGVMGRYDGASAKLQKLERDERELQSAVDAGRISREQYNRALAGINIQRNAVNLAEANNRGRGPEPGTTYTVRWFLAGALVRTQAGITGTTDTYTPPDGSGGKQIRVEVEAIRDGYRSWQIQQHTFLYRAQLVTEAGDRLVTEAGDPLILE